MKFASKLLSLVLAALMITAMLVSCGKDNNTTSSNISFEDVSSISDGEDVQSTVSKTESKKNESTSSKKENSKDNTKSQTASKSVKRVQARQASVLNNLGVGIFHFSPQFCKAYGVTDSAKLKEAEEILAEGYVNTIFLADNEISCFEDTIELCKKYDCTFWVSAGRFYLKSDDIESYMIQKKLTIEKIKKHDAWEYFCGFYWDEPFLNSMTNEDFLTVTKALYEKWGKRNFPVFSMTCFVDKEPLRFDNRTTEKMKPYALKYVTDISWDTYSYDITDPGNKTQQKKIADDAAKWGASFTDTEGLYRYVQSQLDAKFEQQVNVWFYPGVYTTYLWTGGRLGEDLAIANVEFYDKYLSELKHPGGLILYNYYNSESNSSEKGVCSFLETKTNSMYQKTKWHTFSTKLKALKTKYDQKRITPVLDAPFGSLDVFDTTEGKISYYPIVGYKYSINGGKTWSDTGYFEGLELDKEYTIRVKNSKGQTKDFKVTTDYR